MDWICSQIVTLRKTANMKSPPSRIQNRRFARLTSSRRSRRARRLRRWRRNSRWTTNGSSIGGVIGSTRALRARAGAIKRRILAGPHDGCKPVRQPASSALRRIDHHARVEERRILRIGHKGAAALAPENTLESLGKAIEFGVDMVEFDVVDAPDGALVLAHSREEREPDAATLDEALAFLATHAPPALQLDLDLKERGFECRVVDALRRHGLVERSIACSFFAASLRELRRHEPGLRTGLSYPWDR